uniref:Tetratricopeptide repeat protein n=1 Tax=Panagrolaimus superbus TaxID=310955 RepID=A0A914ZA21_9BILA
MRFLNDQQLQMQIANAEGAHRINQGKPQPWPRRNADEEHMRWQMKCLQLNQLKAQKGEAIKSTVVSLCQVIDIPLPNIGVSTLIQDLNGDVEEMIVYNYCYNIDQVGWLKPGTILIIKEPWLRYGLSGTGVSLRIDSPSDIIFVDPTDREFLNKVEANKWYKQMSNDVEVIRGEANEYFKKGKYFDALQLYDRGIRINAELPIIMGLAAYGMHEWQKAANHFIEILKEFPGHIFAGEQLKRSMARLAEQRDGKFDFKMMHFESQKTKSETDVSDYVGPIEITEIPGKV